jgi:hypothetical protein
VAIWVVEQIDPSGIVSACIACRTEARAQDCYQSYETNLSAEQKAAGWIAQVRTVESMDDVPVTPLKLS